MTVNQLKQQILKQAFISAIALTVLLNLATWYFGGGFWTFWPDVIVFIVLFGGSFAAAEKHELKEAALREAARTR